MTVLLLALSAFAAEPVLLQPGQAPHAVYRYAPSAGAKQTVEMRMDMKMSMSMAGMDMPPMDVPSMVYTLETTTGSVSEKGIPYTYEVVGTTVEGEGPVADHMRKDLGKMVGERGEVVVSPRGEVVGEQTTELQPGSGPNLENELGNLSLILPEQAVGVGATWKLEQDLVDGGIAVHQKTSWTLSGVRPDGALVIDIVVETTAEEQEITNQGITSKIVEFASSSKGTSVVHPAKLLPVESKVSGSTTVVAESQMMGTMKTAMTQQIVLAEK
ncbi:MAG: hypothetical protein EP330_28890 [Deltaproteobacteria bacterium]|nr:MAG: hypothetical protein EP330_28890 [Deltaproteobacteria bacterium]